MMQQSKTFSQNIEVTAQHIDIHNHVNNLIYLQWCLDVAEGHWENNTTLALREKYVWYVVNHNITYKAPAFLGEQITVETWVSKSEGVKSIRHFKITRRSDEKVLVEAQTTWCLLIAETLKPTKISNEIRNLFL